MTHRLVGPLLLLVAAGGCSREVKFYCCTDPLQCDPVVTCDKWGTERPFCDLSGSMGDLQTNTCIATPIPDANTGCDGREDCAAPTPACLIATRECVECAEAPDCPTPEQPVCGSSNECAGCTSDADCAGRADGRVNCETATGVCRACVDNGDCSGMTPICDPTAKTCRACGQDGECAAGSGVCNTVDGDAGKGSCVAEDDVVFVDKTALVGNLTCTRTLKCSTIGKGVDAVGTAGDGVTPRATRKWIVVAPGPGGNPNYAETVPAAGVVTKTFVLKGNGAVLQPFPANSPGLLLGFTGLVAADVWLEGLTISGGAGNANADGIRCNGDVTAVPKATLRAVTISSNAGSGIEAAASCNLNVTNSTINGNDAGGIVASSSTVTLLGTTLNTNAGGGLFLTSSNFTIVNNFLLGNGNVGATTRGVRIATIASGANPTLFAFNTMVDNLSNGTPRSFSCTDVDKTVTLSGNLVWGIVDEVDVTPAATEPECVHRYSLLAPNVYADGTNNVDITGVTKASVFESIIDPVNFHLKAGSATINKADMAPIAGVPSTDFDGQPRVQGGRADIGADERE